MEIKVIKGVKISPINQHTANMKNQDYIIQLLEKLDDDDDVQNVYHTMEETDNDDE